jgi:hypothetical protein
MTQSHRTLCYCAQEHASRLYFESQNSAPGPFQVQASMQAHTFEAKAQSLEKAAQAQNLQVSPLPHNLG